MTDLMKACIRDSNSSDGLLRFGDLPKPNEVTDGSVIIKVMAAACNPIDYKLPNFMTKGTAMGYDVAGIVEKSMSPSFKEGDEVFGIIKNSIAEYSQTNAAQLTRKPSHLPWAEAAAIPLAYLTTFQSYTKTCKFDIKDNTVLVIGASGGCGTAGVILAKALGAKEIVGVCSGKNADFVKNLGATEIVDYTCENFVEKYGEKYFDLVYDCASGSGAGENYVYDSKKVLKDNGQILTLNGPPTAWVRKYIRMEEKRVNLVLLDSKNVNEQLDKILSLLGEESKPPVHDPVFSFDQEGLSTGYKLLKSRRAKGKIVFNVGGW